MEKKEKMPNKNTVKEEWDDFANAVLKPQNVSTTQYKEMRKAFYAGAWATLQACKRVANEETDEAAVGILDGMEKECAEFLLTIVASNEY